MINDSEKIEIKKQAQAILESFSEALAEVKLEKKEFKKGESGFREEGEGSEVDDYFRKQMFENAPRTEGDCILAEKKKW